MKFNFPDHKAKREKRSHMPQRMEVSENMIRAKNDIQNNESKTQ